MKYVPGNVFQYVGRNQLAADLHISHVDVACATVLDIVCSMLTPLLLIVVLMGKNMLELIRTYRNNFLIVLGVGVAVLLLLFLVLNVTIQVSFKIFIAVPCLIKKEFVLQMPKNLFGRGIIKAVTFS